MNKRIFLLILIAFVVLGCLAKSPELRQTPAQTSHPTTPAPSETVVTHTSSPRIAQVRTPIPTNEFRFGVKYPAKVIYVYDGDTIKVNLSGQILVIRLLGVDTPEKYPEKNRPYEYDAITNLTYLAEWGWKAKDFAYKMLYNKTVYIEFDKTAGGLLREIPCLRLFRERDRLQRITREKRACKGVQRGKMQERGILPAA